MICLPVFFWGSQDFPAHSYHSSQRHLKLTLQVQLWGAIGAVFKSCSSSRAKTYRELHDLSEEGGSAAATVQAMVFGNGSGPDSASGVAFTRNPSSGDNHFYGEFLLNAQGEDVVAGIRTPAELTMQARLAHGNSLPSLEEKMPKVFRELVAIREQLEKHYKDIHSNMLHHVALSASILLLYFALFTAKGTFFNQYTLNVSDAQN